MRGRSRVLVGLALITWIVFCASLTLIFGSGAERYPVDTETDFDETMFYAGIACFVGAFVVSMGIRLANRGAENGSAGEDEEPGFGLVFMVVTALLAFVAGILIDIVK